MKELWQLIKMLFSSKPGDFDTPELLPMKHYPFKVSSINSIYPLVSDSRTL